MTSLNSSIDIERVEVTQKWTPFRRILFRFVFVYLALCIALAFSFLIQPIYTGMARIFHFPPIYMLFFGSDRAVDYVILLWRAVIAVVVTIVWTVLDRKRLHYSWLSEWLRVAIRFTLGLTMIQYGGVKVIPSQFILGMAQTTLLEPVGNLTPMDLLWLFMGASNSYTVFAGIVEVVGGMLLISRRTTLLGDLICAGALSNVVMLNFSYDVTVKMFSLHLLLMAVFLIVPDIKSLGRFFLLGRAVEKARLSPHFISRKYRRIALILKILVFVGFIASALNMSSQIRRKYQETAPRSALFGVWAIDEFQMDGQIKPPLLTDTNRWRRVIVGYHNLFVIQMMDDSYKYNSAKIDTSKKTLSLDDEAQLPTSLLTYRQLTPSTLEIQGSYSGHKISLKLHREDVSRLRLVRGGFHWFGNEVND